MRDWIGWSWRATAIGVLVLVVGLAAAQAALSEEGVAAAVAGG